jgi:hypothetical protein
MHAQIRFVDPAAAATVLDITDHVGLALQLGHFLRSERKSQPPLYVSLFPDTPFSIRDEYNIALGLSLHKHAAVTKNLSIEPVLPCSKGGVPRFDGLLAFWTKAWNKARQTNEAADAPAVETACAPETPHSFEAANPIVEGIPAKSINEKFIRRFVSKPVSAVRIAARRLIQEIHSNDATIFPCCVYQLLRSLPTTSASLAATAAGHLKMLNLSDQIINICMTM